MPNHDVSELAAITAAKNLCKYVFLVTNKSPKIFRFSLVSRMQTLSLNIIENMFRANDIFVKGGSRAAIQKRMNLLSDALSNLKLLAYLAFLSDEQNCILSKQYEHLSKLAVACQKLLEAWIASHHALLSRSCTK